MNRDGYDRTILLCVANSKQLFFLYLLIMILLLVGTLVINYSNVTDMEESEQERSNEEDSLEGTVATCPKELPLIGELLRKVMTRARSRHDPTSKTCLG